MDEEKKDDGDSQLPQSYADIAGTERANKYQSMSPEAKQRYLTGLKLVKRRSGITAEEVETNPIRKYNTPLQILRAIKSGEVDAKLLTAKQRRGCVAELLHQGMRAIEIADLFGVSPTTITYDKTKILKELGKAVADYNPQQFVGWFFEQAEYHMAAAKRAGNVSLSWGIVTDLARQLSQWGMVVPLDALRAQMEGREKTVVTDPMQLLTDEELRTLTEIANKYDPTGTG